MLDQNQVGKALEACQSDLECDGSFSVPLLQNKTRFNSVFAEILSAYIVRKYQRGSTSAGVLRKLNLLGVYLTVTDRSWILQRFSRVFQVLRSEIAHGGGRIGASPGIYILLNSSVVSLRQS